MNIKLKQKRIQFEPLADRNEHLRARFWEEYAANFVSIRDALSSQSYFNGELRICRNYLQNLSKTGRFLKIDLWNEVHHTPLLDYIWQDYQEVHGIDIAENLVTLAKKILKEKGIAVQAIVGDMRKLPYQNNQFNFVYTMGTIEHIARPAEAMQEIYRILKPGGRAVIGVPNKYEWFGKSIVLGILADTGFKEDGRELSYSWKQLISELECCGFKIISKTGVYFMPWFIRLLDWFFYQKNKKLKYLMFPLIALCDFLSRFEFLRRNGSLLVCIVGK